tara:strand:- start:2169 stop:2858 length:690 start_codon:yes stop_codon:yes gene_type:complete
MSSLLTFNDIEYLTSQIDVNNIDNVFNFFKGSNIIEYIETIKNTIYSNNENFTFPINTKKFKGDLILSKNEFLANIPRNRLFTKNIDGFKIEIKYPSAAISTDPTLDCIHKINNTIITEDNSNILNSLRVSSYKKIKKFVHSDIISRLNKIVIRDTKNLDFRETFVYNSTNIYKLIFYACCYNINYLRKIRLILSKEGNMGYDTLGNITVEQSICYYKLLKELYDKSGD